MSESKTHQSQGSDGGSMQDSSSFCGEDMMKRMAEACGCGPATGEKAGSSEQPGAADEGGGSRCCSGGDADVAAGPGGHDEVVA